MSHHGTGRDDPGQILELIRSIQKSAASRSSTSPNLGVVTAGGRLMWMYAGRIVETGTIDDGLLQAQASYTHWGLLIKPY